MKKLTLFAIVLVVLSGSFCLAQTRVVLRADWNNPQIAFGAGDVEAALVTRHCRVERCSLQQVPDQKEAVFITVATLADQAACKAVVDAGIKLPQSLKPEGFAIRTGRVEGRQYIWVLGADSAGAMYGALELAEIVRCGGLHEVKPVDKNPYMVMRGIKFNIPLDERTPTYHAHTGDAQTKNVAVVWDFEFWKQYIDLMARFRYNFLTLWNLHPFPSLVRVPGYEEVALEDVVTTSGRVKMTMDEKIDFWRRVMRYARERNVDVYFVTWNIFVLGTEGKYGLTDKFDNPTTTDYFRKSVAQLFLTYPDLAGVGITAGENMPRMSFEQKEQWVYDTYGRGVLDAAAALPHRHFVVIHRQHQTGVRQIAEKFRRLIEHPRIDFIFSFKYAKAHCFSSVYQPYCNDYVKELGSLKTIWTLRNDSNYYFRWGAPDFVRAFIRNIPYEVSLGYYYGSDGYVWGRDFLCKDPVESGQLDMARHWYHWLLWGRMGYDPNLSNDRLIALLAVKFPELPSEKLFAAWQDASMIYPITTGFHWGALDFQWYIEGCCSRPSFAQTESGFHDVNRFITLGPHPGTDNNSIPDYVTAVVEGRQLSGTTPLQVAEQLDRHADRALAILQELPSPKDKELRQTLVDIRAMALLGKYYAQKIRGATALALYRKTADKEHQDTAVASLTRAAHYWKQYVNTATSQYVNPIRLNRVGVCDWRALTAEVMRDIDIARQPVN